MKRLYGLTNKKNAIQQIGKKYNRKDALNPAEKQEVHEASQMSIKDHHRISSSRNNPINVYAFLLDNPNDPAKKVSVRSHVYLLSSDFFYRTLELHLIFKRPPTGTSSQS